MNDELEIGRQKLGVLIDDTVNSSTLNWIRSLSSETIVRDACVAFQASDADLSNFVNRLLTGGIDIVIFQTTAGLSQFFQRSLKVTNADRLVNSLNDIKTIAVGELAARKMAELGIRPTTQILENIGWRDVLMLLDQDLPVANLTIGLESNADVHSMAAGLEARGASVIRIASMKFMHPDPSSPEQDILDAIEDGELGTMLFPNPICAARFASLVEARERPILRKNAKQLVVLALGDETQQMLDDRGIVVDVVLSDNQIQSEIRQSMRAIRVGKDRAQQQLSGPGSSSMDQNAPWYDSPFMRAIRMEPVDFTPIWMMRQAGRYMKEYRAIRDKVSFLELCKNSELCSEVMCTAVEKLGVDAAIIFSDLLPMLEPMGCELEYVTGDGPVIHNPIRSTEDVDRINPLTTNQELGFVMQTVRQTRADLPADMPLIGFAGAPFTLASYMIEGSSTRNYLRTKQFMFGDSGAWKELMSKLSLSVIVYLKGQIEAGAQCVQLFDSWAGCLGVDEYKTYVLPFVNEIIDAISPLAPVINFATGNPALLPDLAATRAQVIGIDWRVPLDVAWQTVGYDKTVQGNLDPTVLLTSSDKIREMTGFVLKQAQGRNGHIFNLGHGILQQTPVENAIALVDIVHEMSQR